MFSNVALDVSIGLVFIFLIYSLLASIVQEMVARMLSLRGRMLIKGIRVMLEDNHEEVPNIPFYRYIHAFVSSFVKSVKRFYHPLPENSLVKKFYESPTIKYLSESANNNKPSYLGPVNFSEAMVKLLRGADFDGTVDQMEIIKNRLNEWQQRVNEAQIVKDKDGIKNKIEYVVVRLNEEEIKLGVETLEYMRQLFIDAKGDIEKFKQQLEDWFNHTMDRVNGWYKRQTQTILLIIGFGIAFAFNADSISIYHVLAKDKKAREEIVQMAIDQNNNLGTITDSLKKQRISVPVTIKIGDRDTTIMKDTTIIAASSDYFDTTFGQLQNDAADADKILGLGKPYCIQIDSLKDALDILKTDSASLPDLKTRTASIEKAIAQLQAKTHKLQYGPKQKGGWRTVAGWLITALAVSLGAPFWFDMLNKLVSLRSAGKKSDNAPDNAAKKDKDDTATT